MHCWPGRAFDSVRLFQDRPVGNDAPDQEAFAWQIGVESFLGSVFEQDVLTPVRTNEDFEALLGRALDWSEHELLLHRRIDDRGLQPAEFFLAPGRIVLRLAGA